jgi:hypothetical protein
MATILPAPVWSASGFLGPANDSFMTYAQLRLEVDGILDLP